MTHSELYCIALWVLVKGADSEVSGMKGFASFYLRSLPAPDLRLIQRFEKAWAEAVDTQIQMAKEAGWDNPKPKKP